MNASTTIEVLARHPDGYMQVLQILEVLHAPGLTRVIVTPAMPISALPNRRELAKPEAALTADAEVKHE